jgi:hypothetical protein
MPKRITNWIDFANDYASKKGGKCLSSVCRTGGDKINWECRLGHRWSSSVITARNGHWCKACSFAKQAKTYLDKRMEKAHKIAADRGGKVVSGLIPSAHFKIVWECSEGHSWEAKLNTVDTKCSWCPRCAVSRNGAKYRDRFLEKRLKDARAVAKRHGGECLDNVVYNTRSVLRWKCSRGHVWSAQLSNVFYNGTWCPSCRHRGEQICREVFESKFCFRFPKTNPAWLRGRIPGERALQLDGFCQELRLAFEYDGPQHRMVDGVFNRCRNDLMKAQKRDEWKDSQCAKAGVILIRIPAPILHRDARTEAVAAAEKASAILSGSRPAVRHEIVEVGSGGI